MKLYLVNTDNIYFPQIKDYFKEIVSSYDNGNCRSAMVMLYSTIVCDLILKLRELSDIYSDQKAEKILNEINSRRKEANSSAWEWDLIMKIRTQTELLNDESYAMIEHIYSLRNFSAHPALNEDYELISPTPEMTVAYIKKALDDILTKPSVFAQNIVDRMSDDIASRKEIYIDDFDAFKRFLSRVYFQRMSDKMINQVFRAFWKFVFIKTDGDVFKENRYINRKALEAMLARYSDKICDFIKQNQRYFSVSADDNCLGHLCIMLAYYPQVYDQLEQTVQYQIKKFDAKDAEILKWFITGDMEQHLAIYIPRNDLVPYKILDTVKVICETQGVPRAFPKFLIKHYGRSKSYIAARDRFDEMLAHYLPSFNGADCIDLIETVNSNRQIYDYTGQVSRNDKILEHALSLLPDGFDLENYTHFRYTKATEEPSEGNQDIDNLLDISNSNDDPFAE